MAAFTTPAPAALSVAEMLHRFERDPQPALRFQTGFDLLDREVGGLRQHDLCVLGGRPGAGKTIAALQWARHLAREQTNVVYVCYEHDEREILSRLLTLELGELNVPVMPHETGDRLTILNEVRGGAWSPMHETSRHPLVRAARAGVEYYAPRLIIVAGAAAPTGADLEALCEHYLSYGGVLIVDYLQKVSGYGEHTPANFKSLALQLPIAVVALSSIDDDGLATRRARLHHLSDAAALAYEADVVMLVNDKSAAVANVHLSYDNGNAERFKRFSVFSVEKNRHGPSNVHLEFEKDFLAHRFSTRGAHVVERLIDDSDGSPR